MLDPLTLSLTFEADARNVAEARRALRDAMSQAGAEADLDSAVLALSETVTNAFVHTGGPIKVSVRTHQAGTRVEVEDSSPHLPLMKRYAATAGTGRGLQLVQEVTDRWGTHRSGAGKVVWFEIGKPATDEGGSAGRGEPGGPSGAGDTDHLVTLRRVPLLMHWAWQEHAAALLREYLLHVLDDDDTILDRHAQASVALSVLHEQLPTPDLPDDPDGLMASSLEPHVTADEVVLRIPHESLAHFDTLDDLLARAVQAARAGHFLGPPTQPEVEEMRAWMCEEIAKQAAGMTTATPWMARTDVRATLADRAQLMSTYAELGEVDEPLLATDEGSIIVAASRAALELLGYQRSEDLLGRRVIVVVPTRFHQAHIAGTTLNATNGRDKLLGVPLVVPMVRADGSEVPVSIEVVPERLASDMRVFVARFRPA